MGLELLRRLLSPVTLLLLALIVVLVASSLSDLGVAMVANHSGFKLSREFLMADESLEWNLTYGGSAADGAFSGQQTMDGGYVLAGWTASFSVSGDAWLVKTDAYGNMEWNKTYGGSEADWFNAVQQSSDGGYILAGLTTQYYKYHAWIVKVDAFGIQEWNRTLGGTTEGEAHSVQQTTDGGYIVAGTTFFGANGADAWLWKTDSYGNLEWNRTYEGSGDDVAYDVQQTADGGYIVCGSTTSFGMTMSDVWLFKTNATGAVEWSYVSGFPDIDEARSVQQTRDGGYIVAGFRYWTNRYDFWLIKTNSSGGIEWDKAYGGADEEQAYSVQQTTDGGYIIAGSIRYIPTLKIDAWVVKTDSQGNMDWNKIFGGAKADDAYDIKQTSDGGYIMVGQTESFGAGESDFWAVKFFPKHDVAVDQIIPSKTLVCQGYTLTLNVTVSNPGYYQETFNVTAYANSTAFATQTVHNLPYDATATLTFTWNTIGFPTGKYTLTAYAEPVENETKTANNQLTNATLILVTIPGNVNGDQKVDILDVVKITSIYATNSTNPLFNPNSDIDNDQKITILDVTICTSHYGQKEK